MDELVSGVLQKRATEAPVTGTGLIEMALYISSMTIEQEILMGVLPKAKTRGCHYETLTNRH